MSMLWIEGWDDIPGQSQEIKGWNRTVNTVASKGQKSTYASETLSNNDQLWMNFTNPSSDPTITVGFWWREEASVPPARDVLFRVRGDSGVTVHVGIWIQPDGTMELARGASGTTVLASTAIDTWNKQNEEAYWEFQATINDTTGAVELRKNGVTVASATSVDTKEGGTNSYIDQAEWIGMGQGYLDDVYCLDSQGSVNNDFLGPIHIVTDFPDAEGSTIQWTPSTGTDNSATIDENPADGADYNSDSTPGNIDLLGFPNLSPTPDSIFAVETVVYAQKSDTGTIQLRQRILSNAVADLGSDIPLGTSWLHYKEMWETNPDGGALWTPTALNAAEFGYETRT